MLDETHRGYQIRGRLSAVGYHLTIRTPDGAESTQVYPALISDREARTFAERTIAAIEAGWSLAPAVPFEPAA